MFFLAIAMFLCNFFLPYHSFGRFKAQAFQYMKIPLILNDAFVNTHLSIIILFFVPVFEVSYVFIIFFPLPVTAASNDVSY